MIKINNVTKSFDIQGERINVLNIKELIFETGRTYLLKGASGQGKTTLLNILSGLLLPDSGSVNYDGTDLLALSEPQRDLFRAKNIGYLFQDFNLFDGFTSMENVLIPLMLINKGERKASKEKAEAMLTQLGVAARKDAKVNKLSGGEKQRVALARALVNAPGLIIADEPCGNLDKTNGERIMSLIVAQARDTGATLLVVSHDLSYADMFDEVLDIADLGGAVC